MPSYNSTTFNPPAPVALVGLKHKNTDEMMHFEMLIDTGADSSLVARSIASRLGYNPLVGKGVDVHCELRIVDFEFCIMVYPFQSAIDNSQSEI